MLYKSTSYQPNSIKDDMDCSQPLFLKNLKAEDIKPSMYVPSFDNAFYDVIDPLKYLSFKREKNLVAVVFQIIYIQFH